MIVSQVRFPGIALFGQEVVHPVHPFDLS
jgi:hypothetical protein